MGLGMYAYMSEADQKRVAKGVKAGEVSEMLDSEGDVLSIFGWQALLDNHARVRAAIAEHPLIPEAVYEQVLADPAPSVRKAANSRTPLCLANPTAVAANLRTRYQYGGSARARAAAKIILGEPETYVRVMSGSQFTELMSVAGVKETLSAFDLTKHIHIALDEFCVDNARDVRTLCDALGGYDEDVIATWASSRKSDARAGAAAATKNPELLRKLATDTYDTVRTVAGLNPHAPLDVVAAWLNQAVDISEDVNLWVSVGGEVHSLVEPVLAGKYARLGEWLVTGSFDTSAPLTGSAAEAVTAMLARGGQQCAWGSIHCVTPENLIQALESAGPWVEEVADDISNHSSATSAVLAQASKYTTLSEWDLARIDDSDACEVGVRSVRTCVNDPKRYAARHILATALGPLAGKYSWNAVAANLDAKWAQKMSLAEFTTHLESLLAPATSGAASGAVNA